MLTLERAKRADGEVAPRPSRLALPALVGAATSGLTTYVAMVDPNQPGHFPVCPTLALTGLYCPGCGMLRATHDLLHGDLAGALQRNPLSPLVLTGLVAVFVLWVVARWTGRAVSWTPARWTPWVVGAGLILFTVARNLPGWTWLSPA
jgi:hypothetical protein